MRSNTQATVMEMFSPEPMSGCWLFTGYVNPNGYGHLSFDHRHWQAHKLFYVLLKGAVPEGLTLDHKCRVRSCVNPDHLEAVSSRTNTLRGFGPTADNIRKTHCSKGHPLSGANLYLVPKTSSRHGGRACMTCRHEYTSRSNRNRRKGI